MSGILENPMLIIVIGLSSAAIVGYLGLQSGSKRSLQVAGGILAVTIALCVAERLIQSDEEAVRESLQKMAAAVERDDLPGVLLLIHPQAETMRAQATAEFPRYRFSRVDIKSNLAIIIDKSASPRRAQTKFNVVVEGSDREEAIGSFRVPRYVTVEFEKTADGWMATRYDHRDARDGLLKRQQP